MILAKKWLPTLNMKTLAGTLVISSETQMTYKFYCLWECPLTHSARPKLISHLLQAPAAERLQVGGFVFPFISLVTFTVHGQMSGEHEIINIQLRRATDDDVFVALTVFLRGWTKKSVHSITGRNVSLLRACSEVHCRVQKKWERFPSCRVARWTIIIIILFS